MDTRVEASSPESDAGQAARLSDLINSSWITRAIQSAIELGVFDALNGRSASAAELAEQLACPVPPLQRLAAGRSGHARALPNAPERAFG